MDARRTLLGGRRARPEDRRWGVVVAVAVLALIALAGAAVVFAGNGGGPHKITGTLKDDNINGTPQADLIKGLDGSDHISARAGDDVVQGDKGYDYIRGGGGDDRLLGEGGGGVLNGGKGRDEFNMVDGRPKGGRGDNVIRARDGARDEVNCGGGHDKAFVDRVEDGVYNCEVYKEPPAQH